MLQFILGRASSGKTYTVTQKIAECVANGEYPILLVPEQFSFESEKNILDFLGDSSAQKVSVLSFSRLCDEVERQSGGICGTKLSDADKIIMMSRAISLAKDSLRRWRRYTASTSFAKMMVDTIGEFKLNAITYEELLDAAEKTDDEQLKSKLIDTACIYKQYEMLIAQKFIDSCDRLTRLYYALESNEFFAEKTVFIDSFKGFSGQQYKILERILSQSKKTFVTLIDNPADTRQFGLFSNIKRVKSRITRIAKSHAVTVCDDICLHENHYACEDLACLEEFMCTGKAQGQKISENITICSADSIYTEADFVARSIRRIVREKGARYSDFVIIARDTEPYEDAMETACRKNRISCFIDRPLPLCSQPPAVAMLAALELAKSFSTENILRFLKSGVGILNFESITELENYIYLWNIDGSDWTQGWDMSPDGFSTDENRKEQNHDKLRQLNAWRETVVSPLQKFKAEFNGTAQDMSRAVVMLFERINAKESFISLAREYKSAGESVYYDSMRIAWEKLMGILGSLSRCFGEREISKKEYCDSFKTSVSLETVDVIPQMIDEVIFGAADRIRPSRPKYAFIVGANLGVFPRIEQSGGLFANSERQKLIDLGLEIPDKTFSLAVDEECLLYSNVCCASHGVFISYCAASSDGRAEPSAFVTDIQKSFNCNVLKLPSEISDKNIPETVEDAFSWLCSSVEKQDQSAKTLIESLDTVSPRIKSMLSYRERTNYSVTGENAKKLFGERLYMSASKFDTFSRCHFSYFCKYGLRAQKIEPIEFSNLQRGTLIHYILQKAVEDYGKGLSDLSVTQIGDIVDQYTEQYLGMIEGYKTKETEYFKYLLYGIKRISKYVVQRLAAEFAETDFTPVKCELFIGKDGDIPEIQIPLEDSRSMEFTGVVDRIDVWNGYVRVIDYKSGKREFNLPDILVGQNMQMLLYLYAVTRSEKYGNTPAGILYMKAMRDKGGTPASRRMNGLLADDEEILLAMERQNKGEFIPKLNKTNESSFVSKEDFEKIFSFIEKKLKASGDAIYRGEFSADPIDGLDSSACKYCDYKSICRIENEKIKCVEKISNQEALAQMEGQEQ